MAIGSVTTGTSSAEEIAAASRIGLYLCNKSTTAAEVVWVAFGETAVVGSGVRLKADEEKFFGTDKKAFISGGINMISESGTPAVAYESWEA